MKKTKFNLSSFKGGSILLLTHENADLDTFCSAAIFQKYLKKNNIKSIIGVPSHINEQTSNFASKEKISFVINPNLKLFNKIFIFDFNDYDQLGSLEEDFRLLKKQNNFSVVAFDHHVIEKRSITQSGFISPKSFSTTEVIYDFFNKDFDKKMFFYTAIGILEDTGRFLVSSSELFEKFSKCLKKSSKSYSEVFEFAKHHINEGEKIAFLKATSRAEIKKINHFVVIYSKINFYQSAAATKLLEFGAHISFIYGTEKDNIIKMSLRAETSFKEKNNFNLMKDVLIPLENVIGGEIGGHSGAAQWKGKISEKTLVEEILKIIEKKLLSYKK